MKSLYQKIQLSKRILILAHRHPDEDAKGSSWALASVLKGFGKNVDVFLEGEKTTKQDFSNNNYDLIFVLDCSTRDFVAWPKGIFPNLEKIIIIDHHQITGEWPSKRSLILSSACSTAEVLYYLFKSWRIQLNKKIADFLLMGILGDTGGLIYSYSPSMIGVMRIVADLMDYSQKFNQIISDINFTNYRSVKKVHLAGKVLAKTILLRDLLVLEVDEEEIKNREGRLSVEELIGEMNDVQDAEVCCLIRNKSGHPQRVSLRSRNLDVSLVAGELGGGGHKKAAGFPALGRSREEILEKVEELVKGKS